MEPTPTSAVGATAGFVRADQTPEGQAALARGDSFSPPVPWTRKWEDMVLSMVDPKGELKPVEVDYFFSRAKALGLDPLARQIYPMVFNGRLEAFVSIHGIRIIAQRTGERGAEKVTSRTYKGGDEKNPGELFSVEVAVERKDKSFAFTALMGEFRPKRELRPGESWKEKPELMLTKCAAANAYRMAFPEVLGGLYIPEETEE